MGSKLKYSVIVSLIIVLLLPSAQNKIVLAESLNPWIEEEELPFPTSGNQLLSIDNTLYNFGGGDSSIFHTQIYSSTMGVDGALSSWILKGTLPHSATWFSISGENSYVYMLGGATPAPNFQTVNSTNKVFSSKINNLGEFSSWTEVNSLPQPLARGGSFIFNNRIYYIGGLIHGLNGNESVLSSVYQADILTEGQIGSWSNTNPLPKPLAEFATIVKDNFIYVIAGMQNNGSPSKSIYRGEIDMNTGTINWISLPDIPEGLRRPAYTENNGNIYLIGGYNGSEFTKDTYVGKIDTVNHTVSGWTKLAETLPNGECCSPAISNAKNIYLVGGHDGISYYSKVYRYKVDNSSVFPSIKQNDPLWKNVEYDSANNWSNNKSGIGRWGCALTSASMILSYYGHLINPQQLNSWLLSNDGYVRDGLIDWSAITRYTKISSELNPALPKLEYKRYETYDGKILTTELEASRPAILRLIRNSDKGTHFVVVNDKVDDRFIIADPATDSTDLSYYNGYTPTRIETFVPSNTDLSYLYLYIDPNFSMSVFSPNGKTIKNAFSYEYPLIDQVDDIVGPQSKVFDFSLAKPMIGEYIVRVRGEGQYNLLGKIYDIDANLSKGSFDGKLNKWQADTFSVLVDKTPRINKIDFAFVKKNIEDSYNNGKIMKNNEYRVLLNIINSSEKQYLAGRLWTSKVILGVMQIQIKLAKKAIDSNYSKILNNYVEYLSDSL